MLPTLLHLIHKILLNILTQYLVFFMLVFPYFLLDLIIFGLVFVGSRLVLVKLISYTSICFRTSMITHLILHLFLGCSNFWFCVTRTWYLGSSQIFIGSPIILTLYAEVYWFLVFIVAGWYLIILIWWMFAMMWFCHLLFVITLIINVLLE